jgi:O-antigen ligase
LALIAIVIIFYIRGKTNKTFITPLFSIEKRIGYYKEALLIIKQHPFWGIGLGNFKGKHSFFAHNSYLQIWIELGILGIASYLGIVFIGIKNGIKKIINGRENNLCAPIFCAFLSFAFHNLLDFTFYLPEVSWVWWITLALIIS